MSNFASGGRPSAFNIPDGRRLSTAWLIKQCGWKGFRDADAGVSDRHALVLVNHGHANGAELWDLARKVPAAAADAT